MQLATLLAPSPQHAEWAKTMTNKFAAFSHQSGRAGMMRWIAAFRHEQGWLEESKLRPAKLAHWTTSSAAHARDYADGLTPPIWLTDGTSRIAHVAGIWEDRFWFRYPLEGDFELQVELSDANGSEFAVLAHGLRFQPVGGQRLVEIGATSGI
jgi:hypothetical protein